jgi:hypothetical protein
LVSRPPFLLQNVKEQARERHADSILPRYYGNTSNKCQIFFRAEAVFMPGREFSGGFFPRRGTTPQIQISSDCPTAFLDDAFFPRETATV